MKKIILAILGLTSVALFSQASPQDKATTEAYFKDFNYQIGTPAFQKSRGFTKYDEMMPFLNRIAANHRNLITMTFIGKSQKGHEVPMLTFNKANGVKDKVRVWIQAGLHGNEPASTEGVLYLIQQLAENPDLSHLTDNLEIRIVPMANIDGYNLQERTAANGMDLNRDQTKLTIPESIFLKSAFSNFNAEVAMDFHEFQPYRSDYLQMGKAGYTVPYDVMILYTGNLNVPRSVRKLTENVFVNNAEKALAQNNLTYHDYFTTGDANGTTVFNVGSINARSSATSYALSNAVSTLFEVRGIGIGRTSFKRRTATTFLLAKSYMESAVSHKAELRDILSKSLDDNKHVIIKSNREASVEPLDFIDLRTNKLIQENVEIRNALKSRATLIREIPEAYLLLPSQAALAKKLRVLGLTVNEMKEPQTLSVESYTVTDYHRDAVKYEGINQQTVSTDVKTVSRNFPAGTFVVATDQKNRGLAFETLEPEAGSGFVSLGVIDASPGAELPLYRLTKTQTSQNKK